MKILGNKKNIEHLSEAHARGKLSHAYIINGPKGSGKRTFVDFMAAALLCDKCQKDDEPDLFSMFTGEKPAVRTLKEGPCGECPSCAKTLSGNHPDIIRVSHEKSNIMTVNEIRAQIIGDISVKPYYNTYKIYIVEDAQLMNENAQNALLKTIEEPPEYGIIFLLTENADSLLDTIRSRCIRLDMEKLSPELICQVLKEQFGVNDSDARRFAAFARGNLGRAIELADGGDEAELIDDVTSLMHKISSMNAVDIFEAASSYEKDDAEMVLQICEMWFRDMLVIKSEAETGERDLELYFPAEKEFMNKQGAGISFEGMNDILKAIDAAAERIKANVKAEAVFENLFLAIRRAGKSKRR